MKMCDIIKTMYLISVFLLVLFCNECYSLCPNKTALYAVNATIHTDVRSPGMRISDNFYLYENFAVIHVYQANVTEMCEGMVKNFPKLQILSLINVNLSKIQPNAFQNLENLKELSLAVNHLSDITQGVFTNLPALETLYLSANEISYVQEDSFAGMLNLKRVHLDRNKIVSINGNLFRNCPKINEIDLRFNQIQNIEKNAFEDLRPDNTDPITIRLNQNLINNIDANAFSELNPVILHLENNQLNSITELFHGVKELSKIYLDKNRFACIPDDVILNMRDTSKDLSILNNPLSCDCMDRIGEVLNEELYGKGQLFYNSTFPCDSLKQFGPWE